MMTAIQLYVLGIMSGALASLLFIFWYFAFRKEE